jgi:signal transduction histidine kinase
MDKALDPFSTESPYKAVETNRRKRLVLGVCQRALYYTVIPSLIFVSLLFIRFSIQLLIAVALFIGIIPAILITKKFALQDKPDLGSAFFIAYLILIFFANALLVEGFDSYLVPAYIVLVIMSGMVLPPVGSFQVAALVSFLYLVSQILTSYDLQRITLPNPLGDGLTIMIVFLAYMASAISIDVSTRDLRQSLDDAIKGLIKSNRELERANAMKSQFTARTSHELKTPLSSIIVFTDLALREAYGPLDEKLRGALEFIVDSARKLRTIINNILDLSKIEAGELTLDSCPIELRHLVKESISKLVEGAEKKSLDLHVKISEKMPVQIIGDEDRIKQIITNLVKNAINFTDFGMVEVDIDTYDSQRWQITVKDTGSGIPYEYQKHIFEPYYKFEPVPGSMKSTGLGLAITKHLVELMSGKIFVRSSLGKGSTFTVILPHSSSQ